MGRKPIEASHGVGFGLPIHSPRLSIELQFGAKLKIIPNEKVPSREL